MDITDEQVMLKDGDADYDTSTDCQGQLDHLDPAHIADWTTVFFVRGCGDGQIVERLVDQIFPARLTARNGDVAQALVETLSKVYAIEPDAALVGRAKRRMYVWAERTWAERTTSVYLSPLEMHLLARVVHRMIEEKDPADFNDDVEASPGASA